MFTPQSKDYTVKYSKPVTKSRLEAYVKLFHFYFKKMYS